MSNCLHQGSPSCGFDLSHCIFQNSQDCILLAKLMSVVEAEIEYREFLPQVFFYFRSSAFGGVVAVPSAIVDGSKFFNLFVESSISLRESL